MENWYFETSAVNDLMEKLSLNDALATKHLQLNKNREWQLSPVTLWEVLLTTNEEKRDKIILFCQHLFSKELLPSPAELVVAYIEKGMPIEEKRMELKSDTQISKTWKDLVEDRSLTFRLDHADLKNKVKFIQKTTKNIHNIVKYGDIIVSSEEAFSGLDSSLTRLVEKIPFIKAGEPATKDQKLTYKVSLFFIFILLCGEAELENDVIKQFWEKVGINCPNCRIHYVIEELTTLIHRGPFILMALMAIAQAKGKYPRGVWYDSMHSIYITYSDHFFTNDEHFNAFKTFIPEPLIKYKVHLIAETEMTRHNINQYGILNT